MEDKNQGSTGILHIQVSWEKKENKVAREISSQISQEHIRFLAPALRLIREIKKKKINLIAVDWEAELLLLFCRRAVSNSFATPWTVAHQAPLSMGFPGHEYWSGLPSPSPRGVSDPGIKPGSPALAGGFFIIWASREAVGRIRTPLTKFNYLILTVCNMAFSLAMFTLQAKAKKVS